MQIIFSYSSGQRVSAVVLAVGMDFVRVVAPGRIDGFDLFLREEEWVTETGKAICVEAILFGDEARRPSNLSRKRGKSESTRNELTVAVAGATGS